MMAAVIACAQTVPASARKKKKKKEGKISIPESPEAECGGFCGFTETLNVDQPQTQQESERRKIETAMLISCVCTLCLQQCKRKTHPGQELNDIFNGTKWPTLGNVLFLLQYLLKIQKNIFICEETKIYSYTECIETMTRF